MARICILEDERNLRNAITILLEQAGYDLTVLSDGLNALEKIHAFGPDLVLCDSELPYMNGLDILCALRQMPETKHTPFILMTAHLSTDQLQIATTCRANGFLIKPFTEDELLQKLRSTIT